MLLVLVGIDRSRVEDMENRLKQDVLKEAVDYNNQILVAHENDDFQVIEQWEAVTEVDVQTPLEVYRELSGEHNIPVRMPMWSAFSCVWLSSPHQESLRMLSCGASEEIACTADIMHRNTTSKIFPDRSTLHVISTKSIAQALLLVSKAAGNMTISLPPSRRSRKLCRWEETNSTAPMHEKFSMDDAE